MVGHVRERILKGLVSVLGVVQGSKFSCVVTSVSLLLAIFPLCIFFTFFVLFIQASIHMLLNAKKLL